MARAVRREPSPAAGPKLHAHRLLHERFVHCAAKGRTLVVDRGAIRLLDRQALDQARVAISYDRASARVRDLKAWLIEDTGRVTALENNDAVDVTNADWGSLKTDQRARVLVADGAGPGAVFGWEWTVEEEPLFADHWFAFGAGVPTALERFQLELPAGVEPSVRAFGNDVPARRAAATPGFGKRRDVPALATEAASATGPTWRREFVSRRARPPGPSRCPGAASRPGPTRRAGWRRSTPRAQRRRRASSPPRPPARARRRSNARARSRARCSRSTT
jgi:hypothetical protein